MNKIKLLNQIYLSPKLCSDIIYHFDKSEMSKARLTREVFHKICMKHHIDLCPPMLFDFFDGVGIKIAIIPVGKTEFWSSRIYQDEKTSVSNDYINRNEATLGALELAINIYNDKFKISIKE